MEKKDIYEHLAHIYLDANKKRKKRLFDVRPKDLFFVSLFVILGAILLINISILKNKSLKNRNYFVIKSGIIKLNYNSNPTRQQICSFELNSLNVKRFRALGFSARKTNYQDNVCLKVELLNSLKERSRVSIKNLGEAWGVFQINFKAFNHLTDWSKLMRLSFVIEDLDIKGRKGAVYIDDVKFVR